jgi:early secretory antigenic target protein ESAT-6
MGEYTAVDFGAMQTGEAEFVSTFQALQNTLTTLDAQLQSSLNRWTGEAQTAYYAAKKKWDGAAADMATVVSHLGQVVGVANENYVNAERTNMGMWD